MLTKFYRRLSVGLVVVSLLLAVGITETYIRSSKRYPYYTPESLRKESVLYEPALFARYLFPQVERTTPHYSFNRHGYRGRDFSPNKAKGITRIVVYGGSFVFDQSVKDPNDWPHRIGRILKRRGHSVQTINAGIPGHASFDSLGRFLFEGHRFDPDIVVLVNTWNDIKLFQTGSSLLRRLKPKTNKDPRLFYWNKIDQWLCQFSQLYVRLRSSYIKANHRRKPAIRKKLDQRILGQNLEQYKLTLETFVDAVRNIQAMPVLALQPRLVHEKNSKWERQKIRYRYVGMDHENLLKTFEAADRVIRRLSQRKGVALIDSSSLNGKSNLFSDHIHLSELGSLRFAEMVATQLERCVGGDCR